MQKLGMVIPKGRIYENVVKLLNEAGINIKPNQRAYRPFVSDSELEIKIMKPQNIPKLVQLGYHDAGLSGYDWIIETKADVVELMDLQLDPVKLVAAIPKTLHDEEIRQRKILVASEYDNISRDFLEKERYCYEFLRTFGATEAFPPDDADMIIDNTATGRTLEEHNLRIIATILESSTRFIANKEALANPWKKEKIEQLQMIFQAVLSARERVMLEMNVPQEKFEEIVKILPCMHAPTVAPLYGDQGYAVKIAIKKAEVAKLIPLIKKMGATDILEYELKKVVI